MGGGGEEKREKCWETNLEKNHFDSGCTYVEDKVVAFLYWAFLIYFGNFFGHIVEKRDTESVILVS
jgi:hypothetical protein